MASIIRNFDFFLLRTPRLPSSVIHEVNGQNAELELQQYLSRTFQNPELLDAIFIASKDLFDEAVSALNGADSLSPRLQATLYKYVSRMASRPTPYGKFSGIALGEISEKQSAIELSSDFFTSYRLDMGFTAHLSKQALDSTKLKNHLAFFTNSSLHQAHDHFRYIQYVEQGGKRKYTWVRIPKNPLLVNVLDAAKGGKRFDGLVAQLISMGISEATAQNFLNRLIEVKLLLPEIEPLVTGGTPDKMLSHYLSKSQIGGEVSSVWKRSHNFLKDIGEKGGYAFWAKRQLGNLAGWPGKEIFQADTRVGVLSNQLNSRFTEILAEEIGDLLVLNRSKPTKALQSFCRSFSARYGDMEIPLLEAIDQDSGIGYGDAFTIVTEDSPLLEGLFFSRANDKENHLKQFTLSIFNRENALGEKHIELSNADIATLATALGRDTKTTLPLSFSALGNIIARDWDAVDSGDFRFNLLACGGASAIPLMTRFCHLDTRLEEKLRECVSQEDQQADGTILAEVVYLPENRVGNILMRPNLRKYEIPIIGASAADDENHIIYLSDLMVSVKKGKAMLRSKKLDRVVIPRLSSAHNFHYGMTIYRFLCDLQHQSNSLDISWDWGEWSKLAYLPRVTYRHIILSRARWLVPKESLKAFAALRHKDTIRQLKEQFALPDMVSIADGDNELPINLNNDIGANIFLKQLEKRDLVLYEYLFEPNSSPVRGQGSEYNNEVIIPFMVDETITSPEPKGIESQTVQRGFPPGSEWAYIKIYCGINEGERILQNQIAPLVRQLAEEGRIKKWFFIRYWDPEFHLRVRFHIDEQKADFQTVVSCVNEHLGHLLEYRIIQRLTYDTYDRELERYGAESISLCESIFHIDSETTLPMLPFFKETDGAHTRWLAGARGVDHLLTAFDVDSSTKLHWVEKLRNAFFVEFNADKRLKHGLDVKFREHRQRLEDLFNPDTSGGDSIAAILRNRFMGLCEIKNALKDIVTDRTAQLDLLSSLSHMYINRIFTANQREHEMIIYHFLAKHYLSSIKRGVLKHREVQAL